MDESALKALIKSLESSRDSFELWLNLFSALVAIGVVMEIVFVIREYREEFHDWGRGFVHPPDRPSRLWFVIELFGVALVSIGVAGEFWVDVRVGTVETQIRKANGELLSLVEGKANDASTSAQHAADASTRAKTQADAATIEADKARDKADAVGWKAADLDRQLSKTETELTATLERTARLEGQLSWRTVTPEQAKLIKDFLFSAVFSPSSPFRGEKIGFTYLTGDSEAGEYAEELAKALRSALEGSGAEVAEPTSMSIFGQGPPPTGLVLETQSRSDPAAVLLQRALKSAGIDAPGELMKGSPQKTVSLFVAVKPRQAK